MSGIRNQSLDPALGPACRAAYDLSKETGFADADPISTLTDQSGAGLHLTGVTTARPLFQANEINGYGIAQFDGTDDVLNAATAADWKFLHDGHGVTLIALVKQRDANPDRLDVLADTCAAASANVGVFFALDDRSSVSRNNSVTFSVNKGSSGNQIVAPFINEVARPRTWQIVVARYGCESNAVEQFASGVNDGALFIDGLAVTGSNAANLPHSTSNPTNALKVGNILTLFAKIDLAGLWIFDQALPDDLLSSYLRWISRRFDVGVNRVVTPRYGYNAFPAVVRRSDGTLLATYNASSVHDSLGRTTRIMQQRSSNLGWDWGPPEEVYAHATLTTSGGSLFKTSAGTLLYAGFTDDGSTNIDVFTLRSTNGGVSWGSPITPDHGLTLWSATGNCSFCELSNGHILLTVYGRLTAGTISLSKTVVSTDDGVTWGSAVTIADGPGSSKQWNETAIVKISGTYPNETLLAIIRNDTDNRLDKASSTDSGATWGAKSSAMTGLGGNPALLKAASGTIYCVCRQRTSPMRGVIRFSTDSGTTWSATDYNIDGIPGWNNYSAILETSAERFLIVTSSEITTQSVNPTMSLLRSRVHREAEILLYT